MIQGNEHLEKAMIKLYYENKEALYAWYTKVICDALERKRINKNEDMKAEALSQNGMLKTLLNEKKFLDDVIKEKNIKKEDVKKELIPVVEFLETVPIKEFLEYVFSITKEHLEALLTIPFTEMPQKAPDLWDRIAGYVQFCNIYVKLLLDSSDFDEIWKCPEQMEWVKCYQEKFPLDADGEHEKLKNHLTCVVYALNAIIGKKIDYSFISSEVRHHLVAEMDIKVCPYCNQAYVNGLTYEDDNGKTIYEQYLGDLDHFLPKSVYRLFSMSLWNLIPSCKPCNQIFKKTEVMDLLNPNEEGFDSDCTFQVKWDQNMTVDVLTGLTEPSAFTWEISEFASEEKKKRIQANLDVFHLNTRYNHTKDIIRKTLQRKILYQKRYLEELEDILAEIKVTDSDEKNRILYGVSRNNRHYQHEIYSKMIDDILKW